ncbi:oxysterol-binding protein-related protein 1B isoform X3 [Amborella trichopoda]|uniref:oxysterol-binding protein-related protein 1B isoform X3 n=1 Tax=Amborella trichopoda TaxID=13333 RepID=UPI0005D3F19F|nr:oxysterol-binding protein-related protein 1B isoform X3 [Amborella trichopoda]|eukprot:XP_011622138.1 oxysterol-binding protein-related protein 1B isoform X3 [Amborella trichopoda]
MMLHPLCCVSLEGLGAAPAAGFGQPETTPPPPCPPPRETAEGSGSEVNVAGVLYKWTNFGKGWRSRWFLLRDGLLSYYKIPTPIYHTHPCPRDGGHGDDEMRRTASSSDVQVIGNGLTRANSGSGGRSRRKNVGVVHLKVSAFRESKSDDKRFYIFTEGLDQRLIKDCEEIMLSEFSELQRQLKLLHEGRVTFLDTLKHLEAGNLDVETSGTDEGLSQSNENVGSRRSSRTDSDVFNNNGEKKHEEESDQDKFFDTEEDFCDSIAGGRTNGALKFIECFDNMKNVPLKTENVDQEYPHVERRKKLPDPAQKEKGVSLWSMIKDNVGKDLTRVCLPVYFNEPISSLQKCFEDLEYSYLLDRAFEWGRGGDSLMRILNVAAFAVSGYASSEGRHCKPFNPLLGETYEAEYPDKGLRFFSEKVSHHPMIIACHCEGRGWKLWGDSNLRSKFWGRSIQVDPVGVLTLEFDDGEVFQWSKVTTSIYNLIFGKVYCDHHGTMQIKGNGLFSCMLKFKEQSLIDRNPHQVQGFVNDKMGKKVATLFGKWDDSMYYVAGDVCTKPRGYNPSSDATLLWKRSMPPPNLTRYNLSSFAITLNELTPGLKDKIPPTDSRLRPDQRHLENGEYDMANAEKLRLETRQRMSRKLQENGWKPRWFRNDVGEGTFRYVGGYWEAREEKKWDGCPCIFGQFTGDVISDS